MKRIDNAINIEDLRRRARRRLPRIAFDFIEGGCEDETCLRRNEESFGRYRLVPRYLRDVTGREQSATLFGKTYASPFGIAPTGLAGLARPGADLMLAEAAKLANIPFIQSGASTASIEAVAKVAPEHAWYQLYQPRDLKIADDLVRRAADAGMRTLVLTVDSQGSANQERNLRNGFTQPLRMTPSIMLEALTHPGWMFDYLRHGMPVLDDWRRYAGDNADARAVAAFVQGAGAHGADLGRCGSLPAPVAGHLRAQGHPASRRCGARGRGRRRRDHRFESRRAQARSRAERRSTCSRRSTRRWATG